MFQVHLGQLLNGVQHMEDPSLTHKRPETNQRPNKAQLVEDFSLFCIFMSVLSPKVFYIFISVPPPKVFCILCLSTS